jgi:hypothetical protein
VPAPPKPLLDWHFDSESRYHGFKGPLAVAPMFLRNN